MMQIGVVASRTGVSADAIRFYERSALLPRPRRTPAGYRLYSQRDIEALTFIQRMQALGFTLEEIRELLRIKDAVAQPCAPVRWRLRINGRDIAGYVRPGASPALACRLYAFAPAGGVPSAELMRSAVRKARGRLRP